MIFNKFYVMKMLIKSNTFLEQDQNKLIINQMNYVQRNESNCKKITDFVQFTGYNLYLDNTRILIVFLVLFKRHSLIVH